MSTSTTTHSPRREEVQTFIRQLNERLRPIRDPRTVQETAMRSLGEYLAVSRAFYGEVAPDEDTITIGPEYLRDVRPLPERVKLSDFHDEFRCPLLEARTLVINDILTDLTPDEKHLAAFSFIQMRSGIGVPLVKSDKFVAVVAVHNAAPRTWTSEEIGLLEAVAERTWAAIERARAEERLQLAESRLQIALKKSKMGTFTWYVAEDRGEPDDRMLELFGIERGGVLNLSSALAKSIHAEDRERYAAAIAAATDPEGGGALQEAIRVVHKDGSERWVGVTGHTIFEGRPRRATMIYGMAADITERKRTEEALRKSEEKYRTLFDSIDEGFCLLEILFDESGEAYDYVFLESNAAFERQSGLAGAVGRSILELVPGFESHWARVYGQVAKTGEPTRFEADVTSMDRVFDIYAFSGGSVGENKVAVVFNDITERRRAEEKLRQGSEDLKRFNELMVGREMRMIELKKEINEICLAHGEPARYPLEFEQEGEMRQTANE